MDWLYRKLLTGALRKALVALTVYLVAQGVLEKGDEPAALAKVAEYAPILAAFIWDWVEKYQDAKHRQVAIQASGLSPAKVSALAKDIQLR
jgi:hypothetical protein